MFIWIKNDKISLWEIEVFYISRKSDLLNNIGEKLSNININIENIDLNALIELKEELLKYGQLYSKVRDNSRKKSILNKKS